MVYSKHQIQIQMKIGNKNPNQPIFKLKKSTTIQHDKHLSRQNIRPFFGIASLKI